VPKRRRILSASLSELAGRQAIYGHLGGLGARGLDGSRDWECGKFWICTDGRGWRQSGRPYVSGAGAIIRAAQTMLFLVSFLSFLQDYDADRWPGRRLGWWEKNPAVLLNRRKKEKKSQAGERGSFASWPAYIHTYTYSGVLLSVR